MKDEKTFSALSCPQWLQMLADTGVLRASGQAAGAAKSPPKRKSPPKGSEGEATKGVRGVGGGDKLEKVAATRIFMQVASLWSRLPPPSCNGRVTVM